MLPDRVSNPGPLTYESGALPIALRSPAELHMSQVFEDTFGIFYRIEKLCCDISFVLNRQDASNNGS